VFVSAHNEVREERPLCLKLDIFANAQQHLFFRSREEIIQNAIPPFIYSFDKILLKELDQKKQ
jgi:hypothetical protein